MVYKEHMKVMLDPMEIHKDPLAKFQVLFKMMDMFQETNFKKIMYQLLAEHLLLIKQTKL